jgi:membrane-associated protease RseP (regulator of RpoE activity)
MTTDNLRSDSTETPPTPPTPPTIGVKLRKEAMTFGQPRSAVGLLAAACTLVGVIVGFSMGMFANRTQCHTHHVTTTHAAASPAVVQRAAPGFLGVQIRSDLEEIDAGGDSSAIVQGARVVQVIPNTPAARVGIRAGDLIVRVDAEPVPTMHALMARIRAHDPGERVTVGLFRDGERLDIGAALVALPARHR